jgi:hypothetical protein
MVQRGQVAFVPAGGPGPEALAVGLRFGDKGTHTSRTIMLAEIDALFSALPRNLSTRMRHLATQV